MHRRDVRSRPSVGWHSCDALFSRRDAGHQTIFLEVGSRKAWLASLRMARYGAFSVGASQLEAVKTYIENQPEHHRKRTFQEEYVEFLRRYGVDYEEKYLW